MRYWLAILALTGSAAFAIGASTQLGGGGIVGVSGGGASLVFNYASGFTGVHSDFTFSSGDGSFSDPVAILSNCNSSAHHASVVYYNTKLNISSFQTEFTFQVNGGFGLTFVIQNDPRGTGTSADANGMGYFAYSSNQPLTAIQDSVAINFNATPNAIGAGVAASLVGLYVDGGSLMDAGNAYQDLGPQGITSVGNNDVMDAIVTYDGTTLFLLLTDTTTGSKDYFSWPIDIPLIVGSSTAYVGAGGGCVAVPEEITFNGWKWYQGINTELSAPTFSPSPGAYTTTQTVSISGPAGSTIYYTTNGKPPTTSSSTYSTPLTVSANEIINAVAVKTSYTDSSVSQGAYQVQSSGSPTINFPSGFASAAGLLNIAGVGAISGSNLQVTTGAVQEQLGSAFYGAPVPISTFTSTFTLAFTGGAGGTHNGMMFVIENPALIGYNPLTMTFTAPIGSADTSATMSSTTSVGGVPWAGYLSGQSFPQNMLFSDGVTRAVTLTNGSSTVSFAAPGASEGATVNFIQAPDTAVTGGPYSLGVNGAFQTHDGYAGIGESIGVDFNVWNNEVGLATNGGLPVETAVTGITLGVNPILCTLTYNGTTLSLTLKDTVTSATFGPVNWTVNIPSTVGASTAYVGFTGSSYDSTSGNEVETWTE